MTFVFKRSGDVCRKKRFWSGRFLLVLTFLCVSACSGCARDEPVLRYGREEPAGTKTADAAEFAGTKTADAAELAGTNAGAAADPAAPPEDADASDRTGAVEYTEAASRGEMYTPAKETEPACVVFVCGAVRSPGVYDLPEGARAADAVEAAGGFTPDADREYLNLAAAVADGQKLRVLTAEETARIPEEEKQAGTDGFWPAADETGRTTSDAGFADDGLVDLNTAGKEQLMTLPGIGEARADSIIAWREEHGSFADPHDICSIPGIGEALYEKIRTSVKTG